MGKKYKKREIFGLQNQWNKACIATQVHEPPSCYILTFNNSLFWPNKYHLISVTSSTPNLQYNYTILHPNSIFLIPIINAYSILIFLIFWIMMIIYIFYHKQFKLIHILLELLVFKVMQQNELIRPWVRILMQHKTLIYHAAFQLNHCTLP